MGWLECVRGNVALSMALQCILKKLFVKLLVDGLGVCGWTSRMGYLLTFEAPCFSF